MADQKKFLDYEGVKHLWSKVNMQDYPNNETLMAVINAIDETKADRSELIQSDWDENDETSLTYIQNRTHYLNKTLLSDLSNTFKSANYGFPYAITGSNLFKGMSQNSKYYIEYDNIGYFIQTHQFSGVDILVGDSALTTYPFCFYPASDEDVIGVSTAGYHSILVYEYTELKKLDNMYIPWPDENDALELLGEAEMIEAIAAADGSIYIEDTGVIYTL